MGSLVLRYRLHVGLKLLLGVLVIVVPVVVVVAWLVFGPDYGWRARNRLAMAMLFPIVAVLFGKRVVQFIAGTRGIVVLDTTAKLKGVEVDLTDVAVVSYERWLLGWLSPTFGIFGLRVEGRRYETFLTKQQLAELSAKGSIPKRLMAESGHAA